MRRASAMGKGFVRHGAPLCLQERLRGGLQGIARQEDEARAEVGLLALQEPVETRAIQLRHAHVAQDEVIGARLQLGQRQAPVRHRVHACGHRGAADAPARWPGLSSSSTTRIVLAAHAAASSAPGGAGVDVGTAPTGSVRRNVAPWPSALVTSRVPPWASTIPRHNGSPSPVPTPGGLVVKKGSKMRAWSAERDTRPGVRHRERDLVLRGVVLRGEGDLPGARGGAERLLRVGEEVEEHLLQLVRIPPEGGHLVVEVQVHRSRCRPGRDRPGAPPSRPPAC